MAHSGKTLRVGIDVGGTFTDLVAVDGDGNRVTIKKASTPQAPEAAVLAALEALFERFASPPAIEYLAHSTTIATNALLGQMHLELPRVAFLTTEGFRDVIEIGRQNRSEVYNLFVTRPRPLAIRRDRIAVRERMDFRGSVLVALEQAEVDRVVTLLRRDPPDAVTVGFLHAYANGAHEQMLGEAVRRALPGIPVTLSSEVDPEYREYERFSTALVNAALLPIVERYINNLQSALHSRGVRVPLFVMQSNGGMAAADRAARLPAAMVESGPASGVIAAADLAQRLEIAHVISFDMGGTTAKAGTIAGGAVQVVNEFEAAGTAHSGRSVKGSGYPVRFPFVDLAEISAGGGTIAWIDEADALRVGPLSAGADPGPACYGRSDRATVTDANVVLGRLNNRALLGGSFPIDAHRSRAAVARLADRTGMGVEETAAGIVRIVDAQMSKVLRIVTVERGLDPRDFTMVAFGGNGPLHACALAEELGIARAIVPRDPGVFSAHGLIVAPLRVSFVRPLLSQADSVADRSLRKLFARLEEEAKSALEDQGAAPESLSFVRELDVRYRGQSFEITLELGSGTAAAIETFHAKHELRYGYAVRGEPVEFVAARLTGTARFGIGRHGEQAAQRPKDEHGTRALWLDGRYLGVPVYRREDLADSVVEGPAIVEQYDSSTYVPPAWRAEGSPGILTLEKAR